MKLILIRHGETDWNRERRIQGHTDILLNERGRAQARCIAERLSISGICAVYSSPLARALYTGEAIAKSNSCPVYTRNGLMEIQFGKWEGRTGAEIADTYPERWGNWGLDPAVPLAEGAESLLKVQSRAVQVVEELLKNHGSSDTVCIATHAMPVKTIISYYIGIPAASLINLSIDNCGYNALRFRGDGSAQLLVLNDTGHLVREGLL